MTSPASGMPSQATLYPQKLSSKSISTPPFAMYVKLPADVLQAIKSSNGSGLKLSLGPKMSLSVGDLAFSLSAAPQPTHVDLYKSSGTSAFTNVGRVSHRLTVQGSASAASQLKSHTEILLREKQANKTTLLDLPRSRPAPSNSSIISRPTPSNKPKRLPLSANKPLSAMSINSAPLKAIHLLAINPISPEAMSQKMKLPLSEVVSLLEKYGTNQSDSNLYTLSDARYKDLRVWEWKYSPALRTQVIETATKVFDSLGIPQDHAYRRNLIDPKIKKAEADAAAAEKDATRRALADAEAAEKEAAEKLSFERASEQARATKQAAQSRRTTTSPPTTASSTNSPSMLQKVTKIGTSQKRRSPSLPSETPKPPSPVKSVKPKRPVKTEKSLDSDDPATNSLPISSGSRKPSGARSSPALHPVGTKTPTNGSTKPSSPSPVVSTAVSKKRKVPSSGLSAPTASNGVSIRTTKRVATGTNKSPTSGSSLPAKSPPPAKSIPSPPKPGTAGPDEDMFALAQLFRDKYTIYEKLYRNVSAAAAASASSNNKSTKQTSEDGQRSVRKLVLLHRELEMVKKKLWAMSPPVITNGAISKPTTAGGTGRASSSSLSGGSALKSRSR